MKRFQKVARSIGALITENRYNGFQNVVFIGSTAMVFEVSVEGGGTSIQTGNFPPFVTAAYIIDAVMSGASCLGFKNENFKPCINGLKKWTPFNEL